MRPPFAYFGGKTGMAPRIVDLMPQHRSYIEPFFGSGAVLFAKPPSIHEIVNDLDDAVVTFFRMLRDRREDLELAVGQTPYARTEYDYAEITDDLDDLEVARRFWVRVNQSFAKTAGVRSGWSITTARTQAVPKSVLSRLGRFGALAERLMNVSIERADAADLIDRLATSDTVIYADPPYLAETRRGASPSSVDYRTDMPDQASHRRLAEVLRTTPATVILSGYPSALYEELYGDWWSIDFAVTAHSSNARRSERTGRVERIWSNHEPHHGRLPFIAAEMPA